METFDPHYLDFSAVSARLSPGWPANSLPANWRPWKQPRRPLPIDLFMTEILQRRRAPKIRAPEDLATRHYFGACPYATARAEVVRAVFYALHQSEVNEVRTKATAAMMQVAKTGDDLRNQIAAIAQCLSLVAAAQEHAFDPEVEELSVLRKLDRLLGAHSALKDLSGPLTALYVRRSQNAGNFWRINFVCALFSTWWQLTGRDPSTTQPFTKFLDAAWQSLSPDDLPAVSWESAIDTARERVRVESCDAAPWRVDGGWSAGHPNNASAPESRKTPLPT